jgi:hypothetical protein
MLMKFLVGKYDGKIPRERPRCGYGDDIKMDVGKIRWDSGTEFI